MPRRRLGVALLVPEPVGTEIDGLRRALADPALGRIEPHVTLVPPVNVREEDLDAAMDVLRAAAADAGPLRLDLGPAATFRPETPVIYLAVDGDTEAVTSLRAAVDAEPLVRRSTRPFVPHVTICREFPLERIDEATRSLAGYRASVRVTHLTLLEEKKQDDGRRVWGTLADVVLGRRAVVNRGPLEVELTESSVLDPEGRRFADAEWERFDVATFGVPDPDDPELAVTARRDGEVVGIASGRIAPGRGYLADLLVAERHRGQGVGTQLLSAFEDACARAGARSVDLRTLAGSEAEEVYRRRGWVEESRHPDWRHGHEFVGYRKWLG